MYCVPKNMRYYVIIIKYNYSTTVFIQLSISAVSISPVPAWQDKPSQKVNTKDCRVLRWQVFALLWEGDGCVCWTVVGITGGRHRFRRYRLHRHVTLLTNLALDVVQEPWPIFRSQNYASMRATFAEQDVVDRHARLSGKQPQEEQREKQDELVWRPHAVKNWKAFASGQGVVCCTHLPVLQKPPPLEDVLWACPACNYSSNEAPKTAIHTHIISSVEHGTHWIFYLGMTQCNQNKTATAGTPAAGPREREHPQVSEGAGAAGNSKHVTNRNGSPWITLVPFILPCDPVALSYFVHL